MISKQDFKQLNNHKRTQKYVFFIVFFICSQLGMSQVQISANDLAHYIQLNNNENRLLKYKDDKDALILKLKQLALINSSRKKHHKQTVKLDILASRIANKIAQEAAIKNYMGHFNPQGETPYMRYAFAGGYSHIMENASAISSDQPLPDSPENISEYMKKAHFSFMNEKAPNDGHKQNCINTHHNFVGIGFYLHENQFRYYEEFIDRYIEVKQLPSKASVNEDITISVKPHNNLHIHICLAYYEKFPSPMSIRSINARSTYKDYTNELYHKILPWDMEKTDEDGYTPLQFNFSKKGLYYIQLYLSTDPFKGGKASTKDKIQGSGIVIVVE